MKVEVIATTLTDAKLADQYGADRIELVTGILEGGLTPSYGLIERVVNAVDIPVHVMVRPHSQSFHYNEDDLQTMLKEIRVIKQLGAAGIVIGTLTEENRIDPIGLDRLLAEADDLDVTFHRAFDHVDDQQEGLQHLLKFPQITRVLTSGGQEKAVSSASVQQIKQLVQLTQDTNLTILAGHGLTMESLREFLLSTGVTEVHFGSAVRIGNDPLQPVQGDKLVTIQNIVKDVIEQSEDTDEM